MFNTLLLLFTLVPVIEIFLLIQIGGAIGGINTLLIILATGAVGAALAKSQGLSILNSIQNEMTRGKIPTTEIIHGLMVFGGGLLLLTPGILTDVLGLSMVIPIGRFFWVNLAKKWFEHAIKNGNITVQTYSSHNSYDQSPRSDNTIEAEYEKKEND